MPLMFHNGKLLFTADGKLAMSEDCCCCLDQAATANLYVRYTLLPFVLPENTSCEEFYGYNLNPVHTIDLSPGGHSSSSGTVKWMDEKCGAPGEMSFVDVTRSSTGSDPDAFPSESSHIDVAETYSAKAFRKSIATITVWPTIAPAYEHPVGQACQPENRKWLWYATEFQYSLDGNAPTTVNAGWNATTRTYTAARPHTITIRIP